MKKLIAFLFFSVYLTAQAQIPQTIQKADTANVAIRLAHDSPIGTIVAYGGSSLNLSTQKRLGWFLCNGQRIHKDEFPLFANQVGTIYGTDGGDSVNIPDFRGMFLRGVNAGRTDGYKDPDFNSRVGGDNSTKVGSSQMDAIQNHHHWQKFFRYFEETNVAGMDRATQANIYGLLDYTDKSGAGTPVQGNLRTDEVWSATTTRPSWGVPDNHVHLSLLETRPKNAAVYWLIKVK